MRQSCGGDDGGTDVTSATTASVLSQGQRGRDQAERDRHRRKRKRHRESEPQRERVSMYPTPSVTLGAQLSQSCDLGRG